MIWIIIAIALILVAVFKGNLVPTKSEALPHLALPARIQQWASFIEIAAQEFGIPPDVLAAVIEQESQGDPKAMGSAGEVGLGQLKQIAIDDLIGKGYDVHPRQTTDPLENIRQTAAFLDLQLTRMGALYEGLSAYNQGQRGAEQDLAEAGVQAGEQYATEVLNIINRFTNGKGPT